MPIGLKFQREHRQLGYHIKYLYYFFARRDVLQKRISYGGMNPNDIIYLIKPDFIQYENDGEYIIYDFKNPEHFKALERQAYDGVINVSGFPPAARGWAVL